MTTSTSKLAFTDCEDVFSRALEDPVGIRVMFETHGKAKHFIGRMHRFRELDRKDNAENFEKGHPLHGKSTYDQVVCREPKEEVFSDGTSGWWVYIERMTIDNLIIEPIPSRLPVYKEPKRIGVNKEAAE